MKMLRSLIQDGYTALLEQRCRSAAQAFTELLNGLDPQKIKVNLPPGNLFTNANAFQMNVEGNQHFDFIVLMYRLAEISWIYSRSWEADNALIQPLWLPSV